MNTTVYQILQKVLPKIRDNPGLLEGFVYPRDIDGIRSTGKIPLNLLENVAGNHLFDGKHHERFDITEDEGGYVRSYFRNKADRDDDLKKSFPYVI